MTKDPVAEKQALGPRTWAKSRLTSCRGCWACTCLVPVRQHGALARVPAHSAARGPGETAGRRAGCPRPGRHTRSVA